MHLVTVILAFDNRTWNIGSQQVLIGQCLKAHTVISHFALCHMATTPSSLFPHLQNCKYHFHLIALFRE